MSHYIATTDIADSVAKAFVAANDSRLETWLTNVDNEMKRLAFQNELTEDDILDPINPIIKEYLVACFCLNVFRDNIGSNNITTPLDEKYRIKYDLYTAECERLRPMCTRELIATTEADVRAVDMIGIKFFARG